MKKEFKIGEKAGKVGVEALEEFTSILVEERQLYGRLRVLGYDKRDFWAQVYKDFELPEGSIFGLDNKTGNLTFLRKIGSWEKEDK